MNKTLEYSYLTPLTSKKQGIVDAAAALFRTKGYNATSMRDLATIVGIEPSSIYSHIKSKEELLHHICLTCAYAFTEEMHKITQQEDSPSEKLKKLISLHINMAYEKPNSISVFNDEWKYLRADSMREFMGLRKSYEQSFHEILADGKAKGEFSFLKQDIVFAVIINTISWSYSAQKAQSITAVTAELTHFILQALKP